MRRAVLPLLLTMAACQATGPYFPPPEPAVAAPVSQPVTTLAGEWRVAGIDGRSFDEPYGLALSADDKAIWWAPRCAGFDRPYTLSGTTVRFGPPGGSAARSGPAVRCLPAIPARLDEVFRALDSADRAVRTPANAIEISGGGHSLTLFSQ